MKRNTVVCLLALLLTAGSSLSGCAAAAGDPSIAAAVAVSAASDTDSGADTDSDTDAGGEENGDTETKATALITTRSDLDLADMFTERDESGTYDEEDVTAVITLRGDAVFIDGTGAAADGTTVTITEAGVYVLSGTLDDGEIIVDAGDTDKVQLVLDGVDITNADGPAILVRSADKVFVTLTEGSENTLSDTGEAYAADESLSSNLDGVIFSKADLVLNGSGSLSINASYANGIVGRDDLKITGGTYTITAADKGIEANDSIRIENADITIDTGDDGIHTDTDDTAGKGYVCIASGTLTISAWDDGIHAATALVITGGSITVVASYEGLEGDSIDITGGDIDVTASDDGLNAAFGSSETEGAAPQGGRGGGMDEADASCLCILGGSIHVTAGGDGIDTNGTFLLEGGFRQWKRRPGCGEPCDGDRRHHRRSRRRRDGGHRRGGLHPVLAPLLLPGDHLRRHRGGPDRCRGQ